jgi:hypothetical protein
MSNDDGERQTRSKRARGNNSINQFDAVDADAASPGAETSSHDGNDTDDDAFDDHGDGRRRGRPPSSSSSSSSSSKGALAAASAGTKGPPAPGKRVSLAGMKVAAEKEDGKPRATMHVAIGGFENAGFVWAAKNDGKVTSHHKDAFAFVVVPYVYNTIMELVKDTIRGPPFRYNFDPAVDRIYYFTTESATKGNAVVYKLQLVDPMERGNGKSR